MCRWLLLLLALAAISCGSSAPLEFRWADTPVETEQLTPGYTDFFRSDDLGTVPQLCIDGAEVRYQARNYKSTSGSEVVFFAHDPEAFAARLGVLSDNAILLGGWERITSEPGSLPFPLSLPVGLGVEGQAPDPAPASAYPQAGSFWGNGPIPLPVLALRDCYDYGQRKPTTGASVKAVAVYQHGACGTEVALTDVLDHVVNAVWDGFRNSDKVDGPQSHYRFATAVVQKGSFTDGKQGDVPPGTAVRGGFLFAFHFRADHASSNNEVWGTYKYLLSLRDGVLFIDSDDVTKFELDSSGPFGWAFQDKMRDAAENALPAAIWADSLSRQLYVPPSPATCQTLTDCEVASAFLAATVTVAKLQDAGVASPTTEQLARLRCAIGSRVDCDAIGRPLDLARIWSCSPIQPVFGPAIPCAFRVRAKRLLVFPDALEFIWFDGPEFDNATFGLFVAGLPDSRSRLCTVSLHMRGPAGLYARPFAKVGRRGG